MKLSSFVIVLLYLHVRLIAFSVGCHKHHPLQLELPGRVAGGPEILAFDCNGEGPYVSVSDGRILKWQGSELEWTEFATTTPYRQICDGSTNSMLEPWCGRPSGIKLNPATCEFYTADAYFGLMVVGPNGGPAQQLASSAEGTPFRFTNAMDIDPNSGLVYFTDSSSSIFQRRQYSIPIDSGVRSGRLLKYDPHSKEVTVMYRDLAFPSGVALSKDKSFLLVAESNPFRILRFWLHGERAGYPPQHFAQLPKFPDNIQTDCNGDFWVSLNTKRGNNATDIVAVKLDETGSVVNALYGCCWRS